VQLLDPSHPLSRPHAYRHLVGSLLFLQLSLHLDIPFKFAVLMLSHFCSTPLPRHYAIARRVLHHLKGTGSFHLHYGERKSELLKGLSDADWTGDNSGCVSISGFVWSYGGPISQSAKKQNCVALSSTGPSTAHFVVFSMAFSSPLLHFSPISAVIVQFSSLTFPRSPVLPQFRNLKMRRTLLGCEDLFIYSRQTPS